MFKNTLSSWALSWRLPLITTWLEARKMISAWEWDQTRHFLYNCHMAASAARLACCQHPVNFTGLPPKGFPKENTPPKKKTHAHLGDSRAGNMTSWPKVGQNHTLRARCVNIMRHLFTIIWSPSLKCRAFCFTRKVKEDNRNNKECYQISFFF